MRVLALLLATAGAALGQLSWGLRGGMPLTEAYKARGIYENVPQDWVLGPTFEVMLPLNLGITLDVLYRKHGFIKAGVSATSSMWEFPLMGRYRFGQGALRPFLAAGPTFNKITGAAVRRPAEFVRSSSSGVVFGAGIELNGPLRLTPEIRITRRGSENIKDPTGALLKSRLTQADFLLGLTW